jgi:hypothetical protein
MVDAAKCQRDQKQAASEKPTSSSAVTESPESLDLPVPEDSSYVTGRALYPNSETVVTVESSILCGTGAERAALTA